MQTSRIFTLFLAALFVAVAAKANPMHSACSVQMALLTDPRSIQSQVLGRGLRDYWNELGHIFFEQLGRLQPGDTWLDSGAAEGRAVAQMREGRYREFRALQGKDLSEVRTITVSLHRFQSVVGDTTRHQSHQGKSILDLSSEQLGQVRLITDVFGPAAYEDDFSQVLAHYFDLLTPGGTALLRIGKGTVVRTRNGTFPLVEWIRRHHRSPSIEVVGSVLVLRKPLQGEPEKFPRLKKTNPRDSANPPDRVYEVEE